ncbi:MAG: TolC family protein [Flammeovirgaceae bacterium]|nr:TolC family protein [Flammeovirgaceae bacterium]
MMKRFSVLAVVILFTLPVFAQAPGELTFKEAVKIALRNNVNLNQQQNFLFQAEANKTTSIAQLGPQVSITGNTFRNDGNSFNAQRGEVVNGVIDVFQGQIRAVMPVFNGLSGMNTARQASNQRDAQTEFVRRTSQDVINIVSMQFLQVLLDQQLLLIAQENKQLQEKQFEQVKAQVELGSRSPVDEYNQQAQLKNADLQVLQAEFNLQNDKATLSLTLQIDPAIEYRVLEPDWDVNEVSIDNSSMDELIPIALANRSDLRMAQFNETASRYGMNAQKGNYFPSINAFFNYGSAYNDIHGTPDSLSRDFSQQFFSDNTSQQFGLGFTIPIFRAFQNRSSYVGAKVAYQNNQINTKNMEITVKNDVIRAYRNFHSIQLAYVSTQAQLEAAQMAFNLETDRFDLGITSFVEFANANRTYIQSQTDMAQARYRLLFNG